MRPSLNSLSSALQPVKLTRPARFLQTSCRRRRKKNRLNAGAARWTPPRRWALAQHRTSFSQPGHIRQRAVVPRWPEEPLAQLSWASSPWHRRRSRRTSATRHVVARLSVETHVHRAAARRLPSRRAASQRRGSGDNTPGRRCMGGCAGGAVLKKIAARFSLRGLGARIDTIAHATEAHGVRRATVAAARRTGARVQSCGATAQATAAQKVGEPSFEG